MKTETEGTAPPCQHERLNEEGYCRKCGADMRSGIDLTVATPEPSAPPRGSIFAILQQLVQDHRQTHVQSYARLKEFDAHWQQAERIVDDLHPDGPISTAEPSAPTPPQSWDSTKQHTLMECGSRYCGQHRDVWTHYEDVITPQAGSAPTAPSDAELEVCWARIAELRQLLHNYADEHDRGLSSGTGKRVQCDCIQCEKVRRADKWRWEITERGWLIEKSVDGRAQWLTCAWTFGWTDDAANAIRFCRRDDAEQIASMMENEDIRITEHSWSEAGARAGVHPQPPRTEEK